MAIRVNEDRARVVAGSYLRHVNAVREVRPNSAGVPFSLADAAAVVLPGGMPLGLAFPLEDLPGCYIAVCNADHASDGSGVPSVGPGFLEAFEVWGNVDDDPAPGSTLTELWLRAHTRPNPRGVR